MNEENITPPETTPPAPAPLKPKTALDDTPEEFKARKAKFLKKAPVIAEPIDKTVNCLDMTAKEYAKHKAQSRF